MLAERDCEIAMSPGVRWGTSILAGDPITFEDIGNATAITYPACYRMEMTGARLKEIFEDVADNIFNPDPYYQQGGDMVRLGGLAYSIDVSAPIGRRISDIFAQERRSDRSQQELHCLGLGQRQPSDRGAAHLGRRAQLCRPLEDHPAQGEYSDQGHRRLKDCRDEMSIDFVIERLGDKGTVLAAGLLLETLVWGVRSAKPVLSALGLHGLRARQIRNASRRLALHLCGRYSWHATPDRIRLAERIERPHAEHAGQLVRRHNRRRLVRHRNDTDPRLHRAPPCSRRPGQFAIASVGPCLRGYGAGFAEGILSPLRATLTGLWVIDGEALNASASLHLGAWGGPAVALVWLGAAFYFGVRSRIPAWGWIGGLGVGLTIMGGWALTYWLSQTLFDPPPLKSMTFTGPSAKVLMLFLSQPGGIFDFDAGLIPGVFLGAFLAALFSRELKLEGFQGGPATRRYLLGAVFMGFGGMLAGGCSVGSLSGAAIFATTAWVTLAAIWAGGSGDQLLSTAPAKKRAFQSLNLRLFAAETSDREAWPVATLALRQDHCFARFLSDRE